jgi:hypothetical protein
MKNCPILLREQALNVIKDKTEITPEQKILKKLLYYMDCYCVELKMTELDILLNDKNYEIFYSLFDSVMMKNYFVEA